MKKFNRGKEINRKFSQHKKQMQKLNNDEFKKKSKY